MTPGKFSLGLFAKRRSFWFLALVAASVACRHSQPSQPWTEVPQATELLAKTVQALQPVGNITHAILDVRSDLDQPLTVEVWIDEQGARARADRTQNGHRSSEIIVSVRTYDDLPSLSSGNTPDALSYLVLPWFVPPEADLAATVQSSTVSKKEIEGRQVTSVEQMVVLPDGYPSTLPCPLRRTLVVDPSSYLPISYDGVFLCKEKGFPADYHYSTTYRDIQFLGRDSLAESWFSPEATRAAIIDEEMQALKASGFDVYWLGEELPPDLMMTPDDGLVDARANWRTEDGSVAYFLYGPLHSIGGLKVYQWPVQEGQAQPDCLAKWPVSSRETVMTAFGPALYCDAGEKQLILTIGHTAVRLVYSLNKAQWFIDRANALVPLK